MNGLFTIYVFIDLNTYIYKTEINIYEERNKE